MLNVKRIYAICKMSNFWQATSVSLAWVTETARKRCEKGFIYTESPSTCKNQRLR